MTKVLKRRKKTKQTEMKWNEMWYMHAWNLFKIGNIGTLYLDMLNVKMWWFVFIEDSIQHSTLLIVFKMGTISMGFETLF